MNQTAIYIFKNVVEDTEIVYRGQNITFFLSFSMEKTKNILFANFFNTKYRNS